MVAMAASKENPSCSSSSSSASAYRSLRTPLSPLHHNSSAARPPEHSTPAKASRYHAANPNRALLPPLGVKSPPHLARIPSLPRSPNPVSAVRKLPRDGAPTLDLASRFKPPKEKDHPPVVTPRSKSSIPPCNPRQSKRQTQLFVQQKATVEEPFFVDKARAFCQKLAIQTENENSEKPSRKKWRRFPRESVLRSLRGDNVQEGFLGLSTTGMERLNNNANHCSIVKSSFEEAESVQAHGLNMMQEPLHELSFDIYAGGKFSTDSYAFVPSSKSVSQVRLKNEESEQETIALSACGTKTCDGVFENLTEEKLLTMNMPVEGSPNHAPDSSFSLTLTSPACTLNKSLSLTITPPPRRRLSSTPPAERDLAPDSSFSLTLTSPNCTLNKSLSLTITPPPRRSLSSALPAERDLTPPMQPTQSPDFIKREGVRALLPIDGTCYAAPCALVRDRRKCKPQGVLTVDAGCEILSSAESEPEFGFQQSVQQMPTPAVASVEWMLEETRSFGGDASPELVSASTDLCRMSFPRLSPCQLEPLCEQHAEPTTCCIHDDAHRSQQGSFLQASLSVTGYEWGASSSQGLFSSCRTEASSANPRRSIIFNDDEDTDKSQCVSTNFKSTIMHNVLFEEVPEVSNTSMVFSDDESDECLTLREGVPLGGSPPFEYSLLSSFKVKDSSKMSQKAWSKYLPEEVMLSISGPMDSSLSSQEHEHDGKADANSIVAEAACNYAGSLVSFKDGKSLEKGKYSHLDMAPELHQGSRDISSRLAMAKFLCNITATYLDDIATSLGKDRTDVDPTKETIEEMDNLSLEHSSLMAGRKKMAECCSLLRGLTLETSKSGDSSRTTSECSVNQPSPLSYEDTADSSFVNVKAAGCGTRVAQRFQEQLFAPLDYVEDDQVKALQACNSLKPSPKGMRVPLPRKSTKVETCLPSKGIVAGAYLLTGLFVISHTYNKHVKRAGQLN